MPRRARMVRLWQRVAARAEAKQPAHLPNHCRTAIIEALAEHAVACRLPHMPCMAFWRFWEPRSKPAQQSGGSGADASSPGSSPGCSGGGGGAPQAAGREAEWEALALLLHMIAEGASSSSSTSKEAAAAAHQLLQQLNVSGTAVPAILAHGAVSGSSKAVQFAAARAILLMAQLPANLTQLTEALLRASEAAAASDADGDAAAGRVAGPACVIGAFESDGGRAAGRAAALLWELCYSPASGGTFPKAVQTLQQHGALLLPVLEAALGPEQGRLAGCRWLAAGLLACATYEPPAGGPGAAAAADGMRHLLSSPHAASALQRLVGLLQSDIAAAPPAGGTCGSTGSGSHRCIPRRTGGRRQWWPGPARGQPRHACKVCRPHYPPAPSGGGQAPAQAIGRGSRCCTALQLALETLAALWMTCPLSRAPH